MPMTVTRSARGQVVDADGRPAARILVDVLIYGCDHHRTKWHLWKAYSLETDEAGRFHIPDDRDWAVVALTSGLYYYAADLIVRDPLRKFSPLYIPIDPRSPGGLADALTNPIVVARRRPDEGVPSQSTLLPHRPPGVGEAAQAEDVVPGGKP